MKSKSKSVLFAALAVFGCSAEVDTFEEEAEDGSVSDQFFPSDCEAEVCYRDEATGGLLWEDGERARPEMRRDPAEKSIGTWVTENSKFIVCKLVDDGVSAPAQGGACNPYINYPPSSATSSGTTRQLADLVSEWGFEYGTPGVVAPIFRQQTKIKTDAACSGLMYAASRFCTAMPSVPGPGTVQGKYDLGVAYEQTPGTGLESVLQVTCLIGQIVVPPYLVIKHCDARISLGKLLAYAA